MSISDSMFFWIKYDDTLGSWLIISPIYDNFTECMDKRDAFPEDARMCEKVWG